MQPTSLHTKRFVVWQKRTTAVSQLYFNARGTAEGIPRHMGHPFLTFRIKVTTLEVRQSKAISRKTVKLSVRYRRRSAPNVLPPREGSKILRQRKAPLRKSPTSRNYVTHLSNISRAFSCRVDTICGKSINVSLSSSSTSRLNSLKSQ